jgi:poly(A) polymerase
MAGAVMTIDTEATTTQDNSSPKPAEPGESTKPLNPPRGEPPGPDIEPSRLDADAVRVVLRLRQAGHEAFLVGGCVRDLLVGRTPKDFDIATSATPNQVKGLFRNCRLIGRRFRLAHIYFKGGKILEVSTFRATPAMVDEPQPSEAAEGEVHSEGAEHVAVADREALDAVEHDSEVPTEVVSDVEDEVAPDGASSAAVAGSVAEAPSAAVAPKAEPDLLIVEDNTFGTAVEDARRRDFTINGLFYDPVAGRAIDYVRGLRDLSAREIRTIGDPEKRLREDPVRILRAVRFAAKLGFDIESRTYAAMEGAVEDLPRCSPPRLLEETFRLVRQGSAREALQLVEALGALQLLLPPVDAYLRAQDAAGVEEYWRCVGTMDARLAAGVPFDDSMLLAAILLPIALDEPAEPEAENAPEDDERPVSVAQAIEALLASLVQKARLPRRIAERCRMILLAQRTMAGLRRRRGGLMGFRGHPMFNESLAVFEVWVETTNEHREALAKWKAGAAPSLAVDAEGPRRRRRRRRRTERPSQQASGGESSAPKAPATPPSAPEGSSGSEG